MKTLARKVWTDAALESLPKERGRFGLIDGRLTRMSPASNNHGYVGLRIATALITSEFDGGDVLPGVQLPHDEVLAE